MNLYLTVIKTFSEAGLPAQTGAGFSHFGAEHLIWLAVLGSACLITVFLNGKASGKGRKRIRKVLGLLCFFLRMLTQGTLLCRGTYGIYDLPFHLCSLTVYLILLHVFSEEKSSAWAAMGEILFFPCLPGLVSALVFPGWNESPAFSFYSCSSFISHGAMALYIGLCLKEGSIRPDIKRCWIPVLFLTFYAGLVLPFDLAFGPNFGFLKGPVPGTPLQMIADFLGEGTGYRTGFALLVLGLEFLCYLASGLLYRQKKGSERSERAQDGYNGQ
jgi:uncharacterized membrane protein YwaF